MWKAASREAGSRAARCCGVLTWGMLAIACGRDGGVSDAELGELVIAPKMADHPIEVATAAKDPRELARAIALPHSKVAALLGPHRLTITSSFEVSEAGQVVEQLTDELALDFAGPGAWHGTSNNSADYGRETIFVDGSLYLRARYQRWHKRAPTNDAEPAALRDRFYDAGAATWDLLSPAIAVADGGTATSAGKQAKKIALSFAPQAKKLGKELVAQRKWRETRTVEAVEGEALLDNATGALLSLSLRGTVGFMRDGKAFSMKVSLTSAVQPGPPPAIAPPEAGEVVATPGRMHEVDERDKLLERIAPPLRGGASAPKQAAPPPAPAGDAK